MIMASKNPRITKWVMKKENLKDSVLPCPFCGGIPVIHTKNGNTMILLCLHLECVQMHKAGPPDFELNPEEYLRMKNVLFDRWNNRKPLNNL